MPQTKEIRIYHHYQSMSQHFDEFDWAKDPDVGYKHYNSVILRLASHWKMPCKDIKAAIKQARMEAA